MAATPSTMLPIGTSAPEFALPEPLTGRTVTLGDVVGSAATVVMFICNHCPFVKHVNGQLVQLANDYLVHGVGFVAICANDVTSHPGDAPAKMAEVARQLAYPFPYLYDETQEIAKAYQAACTPDFFVFGPDRTCLYRGQLDDSRPSNDKPVNGADLRAALDAILAGKSPSSDQKPSVGCNIKWKE